MKQLQFMSGKCHSQDTLQVHRPPRHRARLSLPHLEATAHTDVRRSPLSWLRSAGLRSAGLRSWIRDHGLCSSVLRTSLVFLTITTPACRHAPSAPPTPPRTAVQVLIQAGPAINPGEDGQPWPTAVTLYQLSGDPDAPDREPLDPSAVLARGDAAFGALLLDRREYTAFPDTRARLVVSLGPEATHIVAVAHFREPLGDAAVLVYPVPSTRNVDPCFYLGLERSELDGGEFPPPGFDPAAFATTCPSPADIITSPTPSAATKPPVPSDSPPVDQPVPPNSPPPAAAPVPSDSPAPPLSPPSRSP